jgi:hypothetical protein
MLPSSCLGHPSKRLWIYQPQSVSFIDRTFELAWGQDECQVDESSERGSHGDTVALRPIFIGESVNSVQPDADTSRPPMHLDSQIDKPSAFEIGSRATNPPERSSGAMAEEGIRPCGEHGRHPISPLGQKGASHRVDPAPNRVQATFAHPMFDRLGMPTQA